MFVMSCLTARSSETVSTRLPTLMLSPVRTAWSTLKLELEKLMTRQSAGILSPTETEMMSPGTRAEAWIFWRRELRRTRVSSGEYSFRACEEGRVR